MLLPPEEDRGSDFHRPFSRNKVRFHFSNSILKLGKCFLLLWTRPTAVTAAAVAAAVIVLINGQIDAMSPRLLNSLSLDVLAGFYIIIVHFFP